MRRALPACALALALAVAGGPARAHHVVSEAGVAAVAPGPALELVGEAAAFAIEPWSGAWQGGSLRVDWGLLPRLGVYGRLPVVRTAVDGEEAHTGLGDVDLGVTGVVLENSHGSSQLAVGAGVALPTGNPWLGLGCGHPEASVFARGVSVLAGGRLALGGLVAAHLSVGDETATVVPERAASAKHLGVHAFQASGASSGPVLYGSVVAPHTGRELELSTSLMVPHPHLKAQVQGTAHLDLTSAGGHAVDGGLLVGWRFDRPVGLFAGVEHPLAGTERFGWRVHTGVRWSPAQPSDS